VIRIRLLTTAILSVALVALPGSAMAQDEVALEGTDWSLVAYYVEEDGAIAPVPFEVNATLRLEDGTASGYGGCNRFSGSYDLDGSNIEFSEEMSVTLAFCEGAGQAVEDAYLADLGNIGGWSVEGERLELYDNLGDLLLTFEVPSIAWTPTQLAVLIAALDNLEADIDALRTDTDKLNVPTLRDRIKALEAENKKLTNRLEKVEDAPSADPVPETQSSSFNASEKVLLKGIPTRIRNYCSQLRTALPKGTRAAVTCRPNTNVVSTVDYYLLDGSRATTEFGSVMSSYNVPEAAVGGETCADGTKSQNIFLGNGWQAQGCYRENKTAQLRFVDNATDCKKLKVGGKTLGSPAFYIALQAADNDVARAYEWATRGVDEGSGQLTSITQPIPSNAADSPACSS
jgi:heat shock protein HslJ